MRTLISGGKLSHGVVLPSEREMTEGFKISRMTLRAAIDDLAREGLVSRQQGRGTVVKGREADTSRQSVTLLNTHAKVSGFMSFTNEMKARGLEPSSRVLEFTHRMASPPIAGQLNVAIGSPILFLKRVRFANGEPMSLERCYLPYEPFSRLMSFDLSKQSLYEIFEKEFNVVPTEADETIEAVTVDTSDALEMGLSRGDPALRIQRITYDEKSAVIQSEQTLFRADRYCLVFRRHR
jgi:GntR family transcriptional regulator